MTEQMQPGANASSMAEVATGQKLVIYAILANILTVVLTIAVPDLSAVWLLIGLAGVGLAIAGVLQLSNGLGYGAGMKVVLVILLFVPLVSLIMLVMVNAKATTALRAAGYKVGLLGATK